MTQDCSLTLSIADEGNVHSDKRLPKGIRITEADGSSASGIESMSVAHSRYAYDEPWGYLFVHNRKVDQFKQQVDSYNRQHPHDVHDCFIHYSYRYRQKSNGKGVVRQQAPTISGLVFLQGTTTSLQQFLQAYYPQYHLINNCSTGKPASISNRVMQPFMEAVASHPEAVTFLRDPFVKFAQNRTRLRVLTGLFKGLEGYIVRVDRDRQLVMEFGGYAVAIRGVHNEDFEVVE